MFLTAGIRLDLIAFDVFVHPTEIPLSTLLQSHKFCCSDPLAAHSSSWTLGSRRLAIGCALRKPVLEDYALECDGFVPTSLSYLFTYVYLEPRLPICRICLRYVSAYLMGLLEYIYQLVFTYGTPVLSTIPKPLQRSLLV